MRFGLLTQWYDPEPGPAALPGVLARGLHERGHEVRVLTGLPNYPTGKLAAGYQMRLRQQEQLGGVDVHRVALYPDHSSSSIRRMANYASFGAAATVLGLGALRGLDALWVNYSPITVAWPMLTAKLAFGVPSVVHVLDLWPDTVLAGGFATDGRLYRAASSPLNAWCRSMYSAATAVAYISPGVGDVLHGRGVPRDKLHFVPMWADEQVFRPSSVHLRHELGLSEDQIVLLYAGALGGAQGLGSLLQACARIRDPRFVALIAGSGTAESALRSEADELGLTNVCFLGRFPQDQMTELMATADMSYVSLSSHPLSAVTMPSKTQAALAAGRPVVVAADGDVLRIIDEGGTGFTAAAGDVDGITQALDQACELGRPGLAELGKRARRYYDRQFSARSGVDRIEGLLLEAAAKGANA
ncbi:colanic acid biosynthesis fucosyltransferase WcaI [Microlunatus lacustris]